MNLPLLMDLCNVVFYSDKSIVNALRDWLRERSASSVIDVAGGTGFPIIELALMNFDVTYVDGSHAMARSFLEHCGHRKLEKIPNALVCRWGGINRVMPRRFDALLCRGNSLAYINSWRDQGDKDARELNIDDALADFYSLLKPGGYMYLDKYRFNPADINSPSSNRVNGVQCHGTRWSIEWEICISPNTRKRTWRGEYWDELGSTRSKFELTSVLFSTDEVIEACRRAGFIVTPQKKEVGGETNFDVITARRPL